MEKYMNRKIITNNEFRGYRINNGENNNLFCHKKTLDHIADTTEYMTSNHSRTLMVRLDIQPDQDSEHTLSSKDMTRVIENVKRQTDSRFKNGKMILTHTLSGYQKELLQTINHTTIWQYSSMVMQYKMATP